MASNLIIFIVLSVCACVVCYLLGSYVGEQGAKAKILFLKQQEETARHWKEALSKLNQGGQL